jgi:Tol biopolymer transport system component
MIARATPLAIGLALVAVPAGAPSASESPRIAFATDRADNLHRVGVYAIRPDGKGRRRLALPSPPVSEVVRSPDGTRILYTRDVDGRRSLFVALVSGEGERRLATPEPAGGIVLQRSAFSPDGRRVAFTTYTGCGWRCSTTALSLVNVDGTGLEMIDDRGDAPSWAPGGSRLAYAGRGIRVYDLRTRTSHALGDGYRPTWAPRGNRIAYLVVKRGYGVLCFVNADGSRRSCVLGRTAADVVWSPDAKRVAFNEQGPAWLGVVGADGRGLRLFRDRRNRARPAAWSPDGRRLAYTEGLDARQLFVRSVSPPGRPRQVTSEPQFTQFSCVRWRPGRISFEALLLSNDSELAVLDPGAGRPRLLTQNRVEDREPDWSPDGHTIAFVRGSRQKATLRLVGSDGSSDRPLTPAGPWSDRNPSWSPDGTRVAFVRAAGLAANLMVADAASGDVRRVADDAVFAGGVSWSPDGRFLVVPGLVGVGSTDLFVFAADGTRVRRLGVGAGATGPAWSPDGSRILFVRPQSRDTRADLFTVAPDGTRLTWISDDVSLYSQKAAWSPDGTRIIFARVPDQPYPSTNPIVAINADGTGEVRVVDDFSLNLDPAWSR